MFTAIALVAGAGQKDIAGKLHRFIQPRCFCVGFFGAGQGDIVSVLVKRDESFHICGRNRAESAAAFQIRKGRF